MTAAALIPRNSLIWLLVAQVLLVLKDQMEVIH